MPGSARRMECPGKAIIEMLALFLLLQYARHHARLRNALSVLQLRPKAKTYIHATAHRVEDKSRKITLPPGYLTLLPYASPPLVPPVTSNCSPCVDTGRTGRSLSPYPSVSGHVSVLGNCIGVPLNRCASLSPWLRRTRSRAIYRGRLEPMNK